VKDKTEQRDWRSDSLIFLRARWEYLLMLNYTVPSEVLNPYLPPFTELDTWEGQAMISVVGFLFNETRVLGIAWPFHTNFEEVNLRFYIKHFDGKNWKRGVAFVSEIVPKPIIAQIANLWYNEHYSALPMRHTLETDGENIKLRFEWKTRSGERGNSLSAHAGAIAEDIPKGSQEEFIFEHYYGYNKLSQMKTIEYSIAHERWQVYPVQSFELDCDMLDLYGPDFVPYISSKPLSVYLARGSAVNVKLPRHITGPA